jgi:hypothetical protein
MKRFKTLLYVVVGLVLLGCGGTHVVSREKAPQAPYKITAATIAWVDNALLLYEISASARTMGYQPSFGPSDKAYAYARFEVDNLLNTFRRSAAQKIREQFTQKNVAEGIGVFLEIKPTSATWIFGSGRGLTVRASIKESLGGKEIWSVTIDQFGAHWRDDEVLVEKFVSALIVELKSSGWLVE